MLFMLKNYYSSTLVDFVDSIDHYHNYGVSLCLYVSLKAIGNSSGTDLIWIDFNRRVVLVVLWMNVCRILFFLQSFQLIIARATVSCLLRSLLVCLFVVSWFCFINVLLVWLMPSLIQLHFFNIQVMWWRLN